MSVTKINSDNVLLNKIKQLPGVHKVYCYKENNYDVYWIINEYGVNALDILKIVAEMETLVQEANSTTSIEYELFPYSHNENIRKILDNMKVSYNV